MNLSVFTAAQQCPDTLALVTAEHELTFAHLAARVRAALTHLAIQGVTTEAPSPVALVAHPDLRTLELLFALFSLGAPAWLVHPRVPQSETAVARHPYPVLSPGALDLAPAPVPHPVADDDRPLVVIETSGSTGTPRGVVLSRRAFVASATASGANLGWKASDRWLLALPPAHIGGLSIITRCLLARRTVVLGRGTDAGSIAADVERHQITLLSLVPTQAKRLLDSGWNCPTQVRAILVGGASATGPLVVAARERGWPLLTTYGLTEACSQVATQAPGAQATDSVGSPLPGVRLRIRDGHIEVSGPTLFSGYVEPPAAPSVDAIHGTPPLPLTPAPWSDGWYRTGDLGHLDEGGELHVEGRADDVIISGGENVSPQRVEAALQVFPEVISACVFGVVDEQWGQRVEAAVVTAKNGDEKALLSRLRAVLAPHELPRALHRVESLPLTPSGKIDRRAAARLAARLSSAAHRRP